MKPYKCPRCQTPCISAKDKYKAGVWRDIHCTHCGTRLCGHPWLMAVAYMVYFWVFAWFVFWSYFERNWWLLLGLVPSWLLLDYLNVRFMPLVALRAKKPGK